MAKDYKDTAIPWYSFDMIENIKSRYSIRKNGEVYSKASNRALKKTQHGGRNRVKLNTGAKYSWFYVDTLVMALYSTKEPLKYINHQDGNFFNDEYSNLEYESSYESHKRAMPAAFSSDNAFDEVSYDGLRAETLRQWFIIEQKMDEEYAQKKADAMDNFIKSLSQSAIPVEAEQADLRLLLRLERRTPGEARPRVYKDIYELAADENMPLGVALDGVQHAAEMHETFLGSYWRYMG